MILDEGHRNVPLRRTGSSSWAEVALAMRRISFDRGRWLRRSFPAQT